MRRISSRSVSVFFFFFFFFRVIDVDKKDYNRYDTICTTSKRISGFLSLYFWFLLSAFPNSRHVVVKNLAVTMTRDDRRGTLTQLLREIFVDDPRFCRQRRDYTRLLELKHGAYKNLHASATANWQIYLPSVIKLDVMIDRSTSISLRKPMKINCRLSLPM